MAQNDRALFLYNTDVTQFNKYINFKNAALGPELTATIPIGNYTATELAFQIKKQLDLVDGVNTYTVGINRGVSAGLENRLTISSSGSYFSLLFATGTNAANAIWQVIGFNNQDYTSALSYTGYKSIGNVLVPEFAMLDYLPPNLYITQDGSKNVSAAGIKETLVFAQMQFTQAKWKWITNFGNRTQLTEWAAFLQYATKQKKFEFTPSIYEDYDSFYQVTLETTDADSNGMGYKLKQMMGDGLYRFYETGLIKFRIIPT